MNADFRLNVQIDEGILSIEVFDHSPELYIYWGNADGRQKMVGEISYRQALRICGALYDVLENMKAAEE